MDGSRSYLKNKYENNLFRIRQHKVSSHFHRRKGVAMTKAVPECPIESGTPPKLAGHVESSRDARVILVAVGWGERSCAALSCADKLARTMGLGLRLVHVTPDPVCTDAAQTPSSN